MLAVWVAISISMYLVPVGVVWLARTHPARSSQEAALDVPTVVALDILSVVLLSRVVTLELAAWISRAAWLVASGVVLHRRRATLRGFWSRANRREWLGPLCAAVLAVALSTQISTQCGIWDRYWHIPLTASMRGQHAPFFNVYELQPRPLYYHYAGDVVAAMLQILSFDHIHTSNALCRAHDVFFGLFGLVMAPLALAFGARRLPLVLTSVLGMLLAGPVTVLTEGVARPELGRATVPLVSLSFRPHVSLAFLMIAGFLGALLLPVLSGGKTSARATRLCLFSCTALLVLSDETSLALLGALLAVVGLVLPSSLGETRKQSLVASGILLLTIGATILLFGGTFQPGAPHQRLVPVALRVPGFMQASVPLSNTAAWWLFLREFWGVLLVWLAGLVATLKTRNRATAALFLAYSGVAAIGLGCLLTLEINGGGTECHRFATLPMLLAPLWGIFFATRPGLGDRFAEGMITIPVALAIAFPAISSLEWLFGLGHSICERLGMPTYADTDCREQMGARFGQRPTIAYADQSIWYEFAGCRPLNAPSPNTGGGNEVSMGWPEFGWSAVTKLGAWQGDATVTSYCSPTQPDVVCQKALETAAACVKETPRVSRCRVAPVGTYPALPKRK